MSASAAQLPWYQRLTPDAAKSVEAIREQYRAGKLSFSATVLSRAIKQELSLDVNYKTVCEWLNAKT